MHPTLPGLVACASPRQSLIDCSDVAMRWWTCSFCIAKVPTGDAQCWLPEQYHATMWAPGKDRTMDKKVEHLSSDRYTIVPSTMIAMQT